MTLRRPDLLLEEWAREQGVTDDVVFGGYEELGGSLATGLTFGECKGTRYVRRDGTVAYRNVVKLDTGMRFAPRWFGESVLWHEFCHAWARYRDPTASPHGSLFHNLRRTKPRYWLGDMLFKVVGVLWCRREEDAGVEPAGYFVGRPARVSCLAVRPVLR